jgi:hypothetical protein
MADCKMVPDEILGGGKQAESHNPAYAPLSHEFFPLPLPAVCVSAMTPQNPSSVCLARKDCVLSTAPRCIRGIILF